MVMSTPSVSAANQSLLGNGSGVVSPSPIPPGGSATTASVNSASEMEHTVSMTLFFVLAVLGLCILVIHLLIKLKLTYLPESIAVVFVGALIGLLLQLIGNWRKEEAFPPMIFFLVILPPIIFESGYNLHKGNFFHNIGSILLFAILGTVISAAVIGAGVYLVGVAGITYQLTLVESFAFGSLISAVDPVATLAIFQAMKVDPILYMLVFGESILNDAVSIVLMTTVIQVKPEDGGLHALGLAVLNFFKTFLCSAGIGTVFALASALLLKWVDLRKTPSLEVGIMLIFSYAPYCLAEGLHMSGIMAILFAGIVMSHYTHRNLSPVSQITVQHTFRTMAFLAETLVFAYLGLAIFSFSHLLQPSLVIWCIALCLLGRAFNIFPLSFCLNYFRQHKITLKNQLIMWFSGLRGAIAFALAIHLDVRGETRQILVTTTLVIVLFTILVLGGSTMPLMKCLERRPAWMQTYYYYNNPAAGSSRSRRRRRRAREKQEVTLSKTQMGAAMDSEQYSEFAESEVELSGGGPGVPVGPGGHKLQGFIRLDLRYLMPFFTRTFTHKEVTEGRQMMTTLTDKWCQEVRSTPAGEGGDPDDKEDDEDIDEEASHAETSLTAAQQ
ncbi:hypothetical protein BOX15_Mlig019344g1 [Macrostomum lignano]|uniref:Sodium/hydrogen exchanger n=2 Tax=Macrostomum lignano TaxID=282301 RepID=A0A1I8GMG4_9PLAT|nr:hypothetical protein BOX15_Mlig019344g1 [Macrostomum lignano]